MVIAAHPDDAEFGPAATAARWIDAGSEGWLVCCTSGDQGGEDPDADPLELAALRETEQRAAAAIIGYAGVTFLHAPDGALANDLALREQLVREIRTFRPDAVFATDPETVFYKGGGINHTDHRAAGIAAVDAVYPGGTQPDGLPVAGPRRPRRPQGPPALPLLVGPERHLGRRVRDRSTASSTRCARTPARSTTPTALADRIRTLGGRGG